MYIIWWWGMASYSDPLNKDLFMRNEASKQIIQPGYSKKVEYIKICVF